MANDAAIDSATDNLFGPEVIEAIKKGNVSTDEPGLEKMLRENRAKLSVTDDLAAAVDYHRHSCRRA